MLKNISIKILKGICTVALLYSVFIISFITIFDYLSLSIYSDFTTFITEKIIPNVISIIAMIFLVGYIWIPSKKT